FATLAGFGAMIAALDRFPPPWQQVDRLAAGGVAVNDQPAVQRFVDRHTSPGEHVWIIGAHLDHRVADRAGVVNTSPYFGYEGLISQTDVERALDFLRDEGGNKVFESVYPLEAITRQRFPQLAEMLRQRVFEPVSRERPDGFVEWRSGAGGEALPELYRRLSAVAHRLDGDCEFVLVDDGSTDRSRERMVELREHDPRVKLLFLARNFGHQIAISAGLDFASGDAVVILNADLQDPPEV